MARINISTFDAPPADLRREIDEWGGSEMARDLAYLKEICQAFYNKVEKYYLAGATPEIRLQRIDEVCQELARNGFKDNEQIFTIAPKIDTNGLRVCPPGEKCVGGACVPDISDYIP